MKKGVPPGKRYLAPHVTLPAEPVEIIQKGHCLFQFNGLSSAPVVAMPAMKVAGLRDVPLEGENRNGKSALFYFRMGGKIRAVTPNARSERKQQSFFDSSFNSRINYMDWNMAFRSRFVRRDPLNHYFQDQKVLIECGANL